MQLSAKKLNRFLMFKLPSAWLCGVRIQTLTNHTCAVTVTHKWINQNPFNSLFWAVQGMAAEMATGAIVMSAIAESKQPIAMLVVSNNATFTKKAKGKIIFTTYDGEKVTDAITKTIATKEGVTFWMESKGIDENGEVVSTFNFEWSIKIKL